MREKQKPGGKSKGGRPPKHEAEEAGARIIEAAMRLFASRGFAGTSMEQVAQACGAGKDTIYRRYPSKVALFKSVVQHARMKATGRFQNLHRPEGNALVRLEALLRFLLAMNLEHDLIALKRITFSEAVVFDRTDEISLQPDPLMAALVDAVKAAQAQGYLSPAEPSFLAAFLIHSVTSIPTTHAMMGGTDYATAEAQSAYFKAVWDWLVRGVGDKS